MNTTLRRSPRFQSQTSTNQPLFSSTPSFTSVSSTASSSHPSPNSNFSGAQSLAQQTPLTVQSQFLVPAQSFNAPLSSPSASDINPFANSCYSTQYNQATMGGQSQENKNHNMFQGGNIQVQNQQNYQHNSFSAPQRPNYPPTAVNGIPPGLPADFLAEAAKRAQMACLMRDLDDVTL